MTSLAEWLDRLEGVRQEGSGYMARCPTHDDKTPSLSVTEGDGGKVLVTCHATSGCTYESIRAAIFGERPVLALRPVAPPKRQTEPHNPAPLPTGSGVTLYRYHHASGEEAFVVVRRDQPGGKKISQRTPTEHGLYAYEGYKGKRPLYRLPQIAGAGKVVIVEGEKCVHALLDVWPSQHVTTWAGGTKAWHLTDWQPMAGKEISILADADAPGREAAAGIAARMHEMGCSVRLGLPDGETGEDVADWLQKGKEYARGRIATLLVPYEPPGADDDAAEPVDLSALTSNAHYRVLGLDGDAVAIRISAGRIMQRARESMTQPSTLIAIAPIAWWVSCTGQELGARQARVIGDGLIRAADSLGQIDLSLAYGRGAVRLPDGTVAYHLGDRLLVAGETLSLDWNADYTWIAEPAIRMHDSATDEQCWAVAESVMAYRWVSPMHGRRMLGWMVSAIVGGALEWRPHLTLSSPAGAGKSWLVREVMARLLGPLLLRIADATPAAIARATAHSSLPLAVDEAEPSSEWVIDLLSLLRIASGAEGKRIRADSSGTGIQVQEPRFSAFLSATATPRLSKADATRQTEVRLGDEVADWASVRNAIKGAMAHADAVRSRIIRDTPKIVYAVRELGESLQSAGVDSREALAQAALTAGWRWWGLDDQDVTARDEEERERADASDLLFAILSLPVRDPSGPGRTVSAALGINPTAMADLYGLQRDGRGMLVQYGNNGLIRELSRTPWANANLRGVLMQLPDATLTNPVRIGGRKARAVVIPNETLAKLGIGWEERSE